MNAYADFLDRKISTSRPSGIEADGRLCAALKPFQRDLVAWALRRARAALFASTGLGKTLMQLAWADAVERHTGGQILDLTPLAVAEQTIAEAGKFGITGCAYARDQAEADRAAGGRVVVTNYERFESFDISRYAGIILDESSIIKAHDGKTRAMLIKACADVPYKLCCTATPAPNDWRELGNHAEFLDAMSEKEMLAMFFVHDGSMRANSTSDWRLKGHATRAFWEWVSSWAALIRHPQDLGYHEPGYDLPPLHMHQITVPTSGHPADDLFACYAAGPMTLRERIAARRDTVNDRVAATATLVNAKPDRPWLVWCNLNAESEGLVRAIPGAVEVRGTDDAKVKTLNLLGFAGGAPRVLVTKPSIAGFGMNWQHCADMAFVGLNDSFEQLYQAIRRCWRFGQTRPVNAYLVASDREGAVVNNLMAKERAHEEMSGAMLEFMRDITRRTVSTAPPRHSDYRPTVPMEIPQWLMT